MQQHARLEAALLRIHPYRVSAGRSKISVGLIAACPTTVIPFFGDQTFWGSAVYRRGVGPRPIPIDSLSTKKLVAALEFMQRPEVKVEAVKVSKQIQSVSRTPLPPHVP